MPSHLSPTHTVSLAPAITPFYHPTTLRTRITPPSQQTNANTHKQVVEPHQFPGNTYATEVSHRSISLFIIYVGQQNPFVNSSKYGIAPASMCTSACPEEQSVYDDCGGPEANSIYRVGLIGSKVPFPTPSIIRPTGPQPVISPGTDQAGDHGI